jgi:hypothetical protein
MAGGAKRFQILRATVFRFVIEVGHCEGETLGMIQIIRVHLPRLQKGEGKI